MHTTIVPAFLLSVEREEQLAALGFEVHRATDQPTKWIYIDDAGFEVLVEDLGEGRCKVQGNDVAPSTVS